MNKWQKLDEQREKLGEKMNDLQHRIDLHNLDTHSDNYAILRSNNVAATPVRLSDVELANVQKQLTFVTFEYWRVTRDLFIARFGTSYDWINSAFEKASTAWASVVIA